MAFFSPLASGKPTIPTLAAVRSGRRPSRSDAKRKRSALDSHSERGITEIRICERSELRLFFEQREVFHNCGRIYYRILYIGYTICRCTVSPLLSVPFHPINLEKPSKKRCTVSPWISYLIHRTYPKIGVPFHPIIFLEN
jgi:hypothetical protein